MNKENLDLLERLIVVCIQDAQHSCVETSLDIINIKEAILKEWDDNED